MIGKHKKFEPGAYAQFDGPAKQAIAKHLIHTGHRVTVPPENYGPDLYSHWGPRKCYHEVEVSTLWTPGKIFPFVTGSVPERKDKLQDKVGDCELFIWMLRLDLLRAVVFESSVCFQDVWLVEVANKKVESGEYFYRPPMKLGKEFDLCQ